MADDNVLSCKRLNGGDHQPYLQPLIELAFESTVGSDGGVL